jgi:uncharacterized protein YciI
MLAQVQKTFLYEITLFKQFQHKSMWSEREYKIQNEHIAYLDSLTKSGSLQIAGIIDQDLENHTGIIILTTNNYEEAQSIALNDPSVKEGMMSVVIRPINIYFKTEK